jgi:NHL repeat/Beta-propeller repeat
MIEKSRIVMAVLVAATLAACSSAGGSPPLTPGAQDAAVSRGAKAKLVVRVRVPKLKVKRRGAHYISAATKGLALSFTGAQTYSQLFALTPSDPRCSGSPLVCTFVIPLGAGSYAAAAGAYDHAPVDGAFPTGAKALSSATGIPVVVKSGISNALGLTLDGIPASINILGLAPADAGSGFLFRDMGVAVYDASGEAIVGTYGTPVVFTNSDTTGATAVTTSGSDSPPARTLLSSSDTAYLSYSGQTIIPAQITATAGSATNTDLFEVFLPVYVVDSGNNAIKEIPPGCTNTPGCVQTLGGGFSNPTGATADGNGNVYVADFGNNAVKEIPSGCYAAACVETIGGGFSSPIGVAVDTAGNVFVADEGDAKVEKIPAGCTLATCVVILGGSVFRSAFGVARSQSGTIFVSDGSNNSIDSLSPTCIAASCVTVLNTGSAITTPFGIAVDGAGNIYVAEPVTSTIAEIPAGCNAATCIFTIGGGFSGAIGVAADWESDVFVADASNNAAKLIPPGCTASVCVSTFATGFNGPAGIGVF